MVQNVAGEQFFLRLLLGFWCRGEFDNAGRAKALECVERKWRASVVGLIHVDQGLPHPEYVGKRMRDRSVFAFFKDRFQDGTAAATPSPPDETTWQKHPPPSALPSHWINKKPLE